MKLNLCSSVLMVGAFLVLPLSGSSQEQVSDLSPTKWDVVYDLPETKNVRVKRDIPYSSTLTADIYSPPGLKPGTKLPVVVFLNAIGDRSDDKVKNWGIYSSWPRLIAAHGMVGISMDADASRIQESLAGLFTFLEKEGAHHAIDADRVGVYAASANTTESLVYLMSERAYKGIRAAALYYGATPAPRTPIRRDLPVLYILAEGDLQGGFGQQSANLWNRVTEARAPWTLMFASGTIHAFDAFQDDDNSRRIIMQTIAFWKSQLEAVPQPSWPRSAAREIVASTYANDPQKTVDLLSKYIVENSRDAQAYVFRARALNSLGRDDESAADYQKALAIAPNNVFALGGLGQAKFRQRQYAEAETLLTKAVEMGFRNSINYGQLAFSQLALNKNAEAVRSYESAFQMGIPPGANTRGVAYYNMACAYARMQNLDKAIEMTGKAIDEGYVNRNALETDPDLALLRKDSRFKVLLDRIPKQ